jgi:type IV/VI secretion system ImpK/VasF family protein
MNASVIRSFRPLFETLSALAAGQKAASTAELRPLRAELRKRLLALKQELAGRLSEREVYLMLFALVVHFDEVVRTSFPEADHVTWPLLQKELFDTDRGGDLFYQSVTELIEGPRLAPVVGNVYFFCLSVGFRGKFAQEPERRTQVMTRLRDWLAAAAPAATAIELASERPASLPRVPRIRSRLWPWAAAAALVLALWVTLSALASATTAQWRAADVDAEHAARAGREAAARPVTTERPRCKGGAPCRSS